MTTRSAPCAAARVEDLREPGGLCRDDDRTLGLAAVAPVGGRGLGIDVHDRSGKPVHDGRDGRRDAKRGLSCSALLGDNGDHLHMSTRFRVLRL